MSMKRSDFEGYRYKPREVYWITSNLNDGDATSNFALKREFENIAATFNGLVGKVGDAVGDLYDRLGGSGGKDTDSDQLVRVGEGDLEAAYLADKLIEGENVELEIVSGLRHGSAIRINVHSNMIHDAVDFNTLIDEYGKLRPFDDPARLRLEIPHEIPHEHYDFDIYRPYEQYDKNTDPDYEADGSDRGRYQIRWKWVERKPFLFVVQFHRPEHGTVFLSGPRAVRRRSVHQT